MWEYIGRNGAYKIWRKKPQTPCIGWNKWMHQLTRNNAPPEVPNGFFCLGVSLALRNLNPADTVLD